jgi:hypothetical protein
MSQDRSEIASENTNYPDYVEPHTLIVNGVQEIAVRRYIYNSIDKTDTSVLYSDDLKYSFPTSMVSEYGCITYRDALIRYEVTPEGTALHSDDKGELISFVCACLSRRSPINDIITYNVHVFQDKAWTHATARQPADAAALRASPRRC